MTKQRLSKILATWGIASRRACEEFIFSGRVFVNGQKAEKPETFVDPTVDSIVIDGKKIAKKSPDKVCYMLNKPKGFISTSSPHIKKKVIDLITDENCPPRLYTIGRLDKDTEGLILVTNDGHFAHQIMHPSYEIEKEYIAKVDQEISHDHLVTISKGCFIDGSFIKPIRVEKVRRGTVKIVIGDGKKHEVRILLSRAKLNIYELKRVRIGGLALGNLKTGHWKRLSEREQHFLLPRSRKKVIEDQSSETTQESKKGLPV
ncbi:MAG: pseudouridine synthase [Chlamydia sp.]